MVLSPISINQFKSPLRVIANTLLRSRETQKRRLNRKARQLLLLQEAAQDLRRQHRQARQQLKIANARIAELEAENAALRNQPIRLPHDPPIPRHSYGAKMISLCVNLAAAIGLRPAATALTQVLEWLGVDVRCPHWTAIRTWLCRYGVATLQQPTEPADDWIWMADHSNQIGPEKVLVTLGIRASAMPPAGQAIRYEDVRVLAVVPGRQWKKEDVAREYAALAERIGAPMAVLSDGAAELREGAQMLQKTGSRMIQLQDFKHYAANVLKKHLGQDCRFNEFLVQLGQTRSSIQQTELAHFVPPRQKPKARFMNLAATLKWAEMVLWQLSQPRSEGRQGISADRFNQKLGWLRSYREDIARWNRCQAVISHSLTLINEQGLRKGISAVLERVVGQLESCPTSQQTGNELVKFVLDSEQELDAGMRLPMSTEILESAFGRFKTLEKQHTKGGFTSLLCSFAGLLRPSTPESITRGFMRVSVRDMRTWASQALETTVTARRQQAFRESRSHLTSATV